LVVRPISNLLLHFLEPRGEFTVLVPPRKPDVASAQPPPDRAQLAAELGEVTNIMGLRRREALKVVAERHGIAVNALYKLLGDAGS